MALRKILFQNQTEGFYEEFDPASGTHQLDANGGRISNLAAGTAATDAVNKGQLDTAVITGGHVKEMVLHEDQIDNAEGILAANALTIVNNPVNGDTVVLTDGTTTRTYYFGTGTGDVQVTIGGSATITMQNLAAAITADASGVWSAVYSSALDSIAPGVVVIYEEDSAAAPSKVYGVWGTQADCQIVDFGGDIEYDDTTLINLPASAPTNTNFGFHRAPAALLGGEIHYIQNNDTLYSWDTDSDTWMTLSGPGTVPVATSASGGGIIGKVTADSDFGLLITAGVMKINLTASSGLEFSGVSPKTLNIHLEASNPTLQINGSNELGVKFAVTSGLETTGTGLQVNTDDVTISKDGVTGDLKVGRAPKAQEVNNVMDGTGGTIAVGDPVYVSATDVIDEADTTDAKAKVIGLAVAVPTAATVEVVSHGIAEGVIPASGGVAGTPYYLKDGGGITTALPGAGRRVIQVGIAMNADDLWVRIIDYGKKAA